MATKTLSFRKSESIVEEIEQMNERIMRRAYDIYKGSGGILGKDIDNWLAAEQELVWKPAIELRENEDEFLVNLAVPGVEPGDLDIEVTPEDVLIKGGVHHAHDEKRGRVHTCEFASGNLFRAVRFPRRIDPDKVKGECRNGVLYLKAPVAKERLKKQVKTAPLRMSTDDILKRRLHGVA